MNGLMRLPEFPRLFPQVVPPKQCILFLCHHDHPGAMAALKKLRREAPKEFAVVPIFDQTKNKFPVRRYSRESLVATYEEVQAQLGYPRRFDYAPGSFTPGKSDTLLMWFYNTRPEFEFYWVMEYDVRYTGHWSHFFRSFRNNQKDLLGTTVFRYDFRPEWHHWQSLNGPDHIPLKERLRFFTPIFRLSRKSLSVLDREYRSGWSGHYEALIPTLLHRVGLEIEDIGGTGEFVPADATSRHYSNTPEQPGLKPGTFVFGESISIPAKPARNKLWHPIKG